MTSTNKPSRTNAKLTLVAIFVEYYIMAGRAFVVAKEVFHHRNGNILKLWEWLNDDKQFFLSKFNYINKHFYFEKKNYHSNWDILTREIFSPNMTHPAWLSFTNELKFDD